MIYLVIVSKNNNNKFMGDTFLYMRDCERAKSASMNAELVTKQGDVVEKRRARAAVVKLKLRYNSV